MFSLWLSKFHYFFNTIKGQGFKLFFVIFSFISNFPRVLLKKRYIWVVGMITILLPCFINVNLLFSCEMVFENLKCLKMAEIARKQEFPKIAGTTSLGDLGVVLQEDELGVKGIPECSGGFVKLSDVVKIKGISIPNPSTKDCTKDSKTTRNECYFIGTKVQFLAALLLGGLSGAVIGTAIIKFIFWITQPMLSGVFFTSA